MSENLPKSIRYKNYEIKPDSQKVIIGNTERWNTQFRIWEHKGDAVRTLKFHDKLTYSSKEDAIKHCFKAGKSIIDDMHKQGKFNSGTVNQ